MVTFVHRVCEIGNDSFSLVFTNTILNLQQYVAVRLLTLSKSILSKRNSK
ncbi:unnamed protein product [Tenebrio molitor]|nr:unnamed protein product [Tenebrio molitor]